MQTMKQVFLSRFGPAAGRLVNYRYISAGTPGGLGVPLPVPACSTNQQIFGFVRSQSDDAFTGSSIATSTKRLSNQCSNGVTHNDCGFCTSTNLNAKRLLSSRSITGSSNLTASVSTYSCAPASQRHPLTIPTRGFHFYTTEPFHPIPGKVPEWMTASEAVSMIRSGKVIILLVLKSVRFSVSYHLVYQYHSSVNEWNS